MTSFNDFSLLAPLLKALSHEGYATPTPIQAKAIPIALEGRDILGTAQTGTGKTAAFALPILHRLGKSGTTRKPKSCRALILSPTRELAGQIAESFHAYGRFMHLSSMAVYGGASIGVQIRRLASGVDILIATPGRLLDLVGQKAVSLADVEVLVLDEADQMMDLGFIVPLKRINALLPRVRQSLFFSATMPKAIAALADEFLTEPQRVSVAPVASTAENVTQGVMFVNGVAKQDTLHAILADPAFERTMVFTRTKHGADKVTRRLAQHGIEAVVLHGNRSQAQRQRALKEFKDGISRVMVATDVAARGIDIDGVSHVINFDLPNIAESYVHRIGRTARAGARGQAISFCSGEERAFLRDIEKLTRQSIPVMAAPDLPAQPRRDGLNPAQADASAGAARVGMPPIARTEPVARATRENPQGNGKPFRSRRDPARRPGRGGKPRAA